MTFFAPAVRTAIWFTGLTSLAACSSSRDLEVSALEQNDTVRMGSGSGSGSGMPPPPVDASMGSGSGSGMPPPVDADMGSGSGSGSGMPPVDAGIGSDAPAPPDAFIPPDAPPPPPPPPPTCEVNDLVMSGRGDLVGKAGVQPVADTSSCECPTIAEPDGSPTFVPGGLDGWGPQFPTDHSGVHGLVSTAWIGQQQDCVTLHAQRSPYSPTTHVWYIASDATGMMPKLDLGGAQYGDVLTVTALDGIASDISEVMLAYGSNDPTIPAVLAVGSGGGPILRIQATLIPGFNDFRSVLDPWTLAEETVRRAREQMRREDAEKLFTTTNPIERISGTTPDEFKTVGKSVARMAIPSDQHIEFFTQPKLGTFVRFPGAKGTIDRGMISACTGTQVKPADIAADKSLIVTAQHCVRDLDGGTSTQEDATYLRADVGWRLTAFNKYLNLFKGTPAEKATIDKVTVRDLDKRLEFQYAHYNYVGGSDVLALAAAKGADGLILGPFEGKKGSKLTPAATLEANDLDVIFLVPPARRADSVVYGFGGGGGNDPITKDRRIIAMVGHPKGEPQALSWADPVTEAVANLPPAVAPKFSMNGFARQLERYDGSETKPPGMTFWNINMFSTIPSLGGNSGALWIYRVFGDQSVMANRPKATDDGKCPAACTWQAHAVHHGGIVSNPTTQPATSWIRYPGRNMASDIGSLYEPVLWSNP